VIADSGRGSWWSLEEVCAGVSEGEIPFSSGMYTGSHVVSAEGEGTILRRVIDILPRLASTNLLKMDIEGAEWPILEDPRFDGPLAIVMEYHSVDGPRPENHRKVERLLGERGYRVFPIFQMDDGMGMVWALKARHWSPGGTTT
jgi:hypothetical protein